MNVTEENNATRTFVDMCILRATVSTTGYCGGDSGHGGRTEIILDDLGNTDIDATVTETPDKRIAIQLGGDAELRVIIQALRFSADALEALCRVSRDAVTFDSDLGPEPKDSDLPF